MASEKSVLLIPFKRFEFHTEMPLADINDVNKLEKNEFYPLMLANFTQAFELNSNAQLQFQIIDNEDLAELYKKVSYEMQGSQGHFMSNLERFDKSAFKSMLEDYDCDYVIFINWYRIMRTKKAAKVGKIRKINQYGMHFIDYDVYNEKQELVQKESHMDFSVEPTGENLSRLGVHLDDLRPVYSELAKEISENIQGIK